MLYEYYAYSYTTFLHNVLYTNFGYAFMICFAICYLLNKNLLWEKERIGNLKKKDPTIKPF